MSDIEKVMGVLDVHRWKTYKDDTLECECGEIITGKTEGEYYHSPLDEAFRRHIAEAVVADLMAFQPEMIRETMELAWNQGFQAAQHAPWKNNPYLRHE